MKNLRSLMKGFVIISILIVCTFGAGIKLGMEITTNVVVDTMYSDTVAYDAGFYAGMGASMDWISAFQYGDKAIRDSLMLNFPDPKEYRELSHNGLTIGGTI